VYSTFLGGSRSDRVQGLDIDRDGAVYVTGGTNSDDFPITSGATDQSATGTPRVMGAGLVILGEAFLAKLSPDGSALEYSTYLGGADAEEGIGVSVGKGGKAFVTGQTFSADYPTTRGAYDRRLNTSEVPPNACSDIFVSKVGAAGRAIRYSTLIGGSRLDFAWDLDVEAGRAYVMGESTGDDAPTTPGAFQPRGHVNSGPESADCTSPLAQFNDADPLVIKVAPSGSRLAYSTYLGGSRHEHGLGIAVRDRAAYLAGHTNSHDFPTTEGALDRVPKGTDTAYDGFVAKMGPHGRGLAYSTLLGSGGDDWVYDIDVDQSGSTYLTGQTTSPDFPTTDDAADPSYAGSLTAFMDGFVARLAPDGSDLLYSSYLGGLGPDIGNAIVQRGDSAYVAGITFSPDLAVSGNAYAPVFKGPPGYSDGFLAKFSDFAASPRAR
jgi:hypothetical protein